MLDVKFKFPKLDGVLKKNHERIEMALAATMQTNRSLLFDAEGNANGHKKWKPLVFREGKPLLKTGTLRKSIAPRNDGLRPGHSDGSVVRFNNGVVTIGTSLAYAKIQNEGGIIRAQNKKALKIPTGDGNYIFRKKVEIPARDFTSITPADEQEFGETLLNVMIQILGEVK